MPEAFIINAQVLKAVTKIFFRGCHVELERRRREDRGAERGAVWGGGVPLLRKFLHFLNFKMVSFVDACMDFCLVFGKLAN